MKGNQPIGMKLSYENVMLSGHVVKELGRVEWGIRGKYEDEYKWDT